MFQSKEPGSTGELPRIDICSKADLDDWMASDEGDRFFSYLLVITQDPSGLLNEEHALDILGDLYKSACRRIERGQFFKGDKLPLNYFFYSLAGLRASTHYTIELKRISRYTNLGFDSGDIVDSKMTDAKSDEIMRRVQKVLDDLPPKQKLAANLYINLTLSPPVRSGQRISLAKEVARTLAEDHRIEMTPAAVGQNWQRARIKIREILGNEDWR